MVLYSRFTSLFMFALFFVLTISTITQVEAAKESIKQVMKSSLRSATARFIPDCQFPGEYCQSCKNCIYDTESDILSCECQTIAGSYDPPSIIQPSICYGLIQNDDGQLVCTRCQFIGDYCNTCIDCTYDTSTDVLACNCEGSDGAYNHATSIKRSSCTGEIDNQDGKLVCDYT